MAATKEEIKELAEHIYDLDAEVYVHLGSSLGRVFNRDRERCVNELTELLTTRPQGHLVRSELGLIANMARTIEDKEERAMCMTEYNRILNEVMSLPTSFASGDVIDPILKGGGIECGKAKRPGRAFFENAFPHLPGRAFITAIGHEGGA